MLHLRPQIRILSRYAYLCSHRNYNQSRGQHQQTKSTRKLTACRDVVPVFTNACLFPENAAIKDRIGTYSYGNILASAQDLSLEILRKVDGRENRRILFLCPNDVRYVITLYAIWMCGQIGVPLSPLHPKNVLLYYANDTKASLLITTHKYADLMQRVAKNTNTPLHILDDKLQLNTTLKQPETSQLHPLLNPSSTNHRDALIVYTSGTTGNPKGAVLTHKNLAFQCNTLIEAWHWSDKDVLLHTLPLHHVHGIVNALLCPLYVGAKVVMVSKFDANLVWSMLLGLNAAPNDKRVSVYMAVPTIYSKLIEEYRRVLSSDPKMVAHIKNTLQNKIRLMVSGSAPLPTSVFDKWLTLSGHRLLERYGMTEVGMALSSLYSPDDREPGFVGLPLPGVSVKLVDREETLLECSNNSDEISCRNFTTEASIVTGELFVKSDGVFKEYYNRPEATKAEFTSDGWFRTGDVAAYSVERRKFKILGRKSADIIKTGGYKVSALEVETVLLNHPDIKDCSVVGLKDKEWGQVVAAVVVVDSLVVDGEDRTFADELREWAGDKLAKYALPTRVVIVKKIAKNAMGKVNKKELVETMFGK